MRASLTSALLALAAVTVVACSAGPGEAEAPSDDAQAVVSTADGEALQKRLGAILAAGEMAHVEPAREAAAVEALDAAARGDLGELRALNGGTLTDLGGHAFDIRRRDGSAITIASHAYRAENGVDGLSVVRVSGLSRRESPDGADAFLFAERDTSVVAADESGNPVVRSTSTAVYTLDGKGPKRVSQTVAHPSDAHALGSAPPVSTESLHVLDSPAPAVGNTTLCNMCVSAIQMIEIGNGTGVIAKSTDLLVTGASWLLAQHHFRVLGCAFVAAAAAAPEVAEGAAAGTVAEPGGGTAVGAVAGAIAAAPAASAAYRGCAWIAAAAVAFTSLRGVLPTDTAGQIAACNAIANGLPHGTTDNSWCSSHSTLSACSYVTLSKATTPHDRCMAVASCASSANCPDANALCPDLYLASTADGDAARAACLRIAGAMKSRVGDGCALSLQDPSSVEALCRSVENP